LETFLSFGFTTLANSQLRNSVARIVSIERACRRMDVDLGQFLAALNSRRLEVSSSAAQLPFVPLGALYAAGTGFAKESGAILVAPHSCDSAHSVSQR
jgi:hypothetical protein